MKNLNISDIQAVSGGNVVEFAAAAFLGQALMPAALYIPTLLLGTLSATAEAIGPMTSIARILAPAIGMASYALYTYSPDELQNMLDSAHAKIAG